MMRTLLALMVSGTVAILSLPVQASDARTGGARNADGDEFSSRARGGRTSGVSRLHYYDPYPWWCSPPYTKRARTNYLGWPHTIYPPDYDRPYFGGVAGHPGGFGIYY